MDSATLPWPRGRTADVLVVLVALAVVVPVSLLATEEPASVLPPWLSWPLQLGACLALYWRRDHPQPVMAATLVLVGLYYPLTGEGSPVFMTVMAALFSVAESGRMRASIGWATVVMVLSVGGELASPVRHLDNIALAMLAGWCVATVAIGVIVHDRAVLLAETRHRAAETALRQATQERLRIAREVHDVVGHHLSLINVQASAALHRIHREPSQAETALATIKSASGQTLGELRTTLDVLRHGEERAPVEPSRGLSDLEELFAGLRSADVTVEYRLSGRIRRLPVETDLAGYRIVQEALTNVVKHAAAGRAAVRVEHRDDTVAIEVTDDGTAATANAAGHGIRGMTERAVALGGELSAGPRPGGGFAVRAILPAPEAT